MRIAFALLLLIAPGLTGCAHHKKAAPTPPPAPARSAAAKPAEMPSAPVVTPGSGLTGKVARYNAAGRFVVLEFPIGHLPSLEQRMFVFRGDLKVGEVKVTGPQRDDHIVADLTNGEAQAGDEVRDK